MSYSVKEIYLTLQGEGGQTDESAKEQEAEYVEAEGEASG